jgi:hypothetical protein
MGKLMKKRQAHPPSLELVRPLSCRTKVGEIDMVADAPGCRFRGGRC